MNPKFWSIIPDLENESQSLVFITGIQKQKEIFWWNNVQLNLETASGITFDVNDAFPSFLKFWTTSVTIVNTYNS